MSEDCFYCKAVEGTLDLYKIYEDKDFMAVLNQRPAAIGQIILFPKKHHAIFEAMPDYEVGNMFSLANKMSRVIFETIGCQGTNILLNSGIVAGQESSHVSLHIIPRGEDDGINLQWKAKPMNEEEMSTIEIQLKQACETIGSFEKKEKIIPVKLEKEIEKVKEKADNYLFRQIERIP
jgi:histidine triad (HIT) family protein